ncbi:MAG TPA: ATP-dependent Clp protease ATP-binding subunit [Candidatus Obscuribacterales bacterium]
MSSQLCEICHQRPATMTVRMSEDGRERALNICDYDYRRLRRRERRASPFESMFGSDLFNDFFGSQFGDEFPSPGQRIGDRGRAREETIDLNDYFSEQTKEILQHAAQRTAELGRKEVDTEQLLFALADNEVVQTILDQFKLSAADLKRYIEENYFKREQSEPSNESEQVGASPRLKSALQLAFQASREMGHSYVGPEHLLVGLAEEEDGIAGQILRKFGLTPQALRQQTVKVVGKGAEEGKVQAPTNTPTLDKYSRDLTDLAKKGKLDPVIGRAQEIETTIEVLARRKKNNPVLIGEPGVGKTAIVEGLAQRIARNEVPEVLRDKRLIELNVNSMVAGSKYRGEFEERIKSVLDEVTEHQNELIIFIDELHTIVGAGSAGGEGGLDVANTFKPALARGELHLIGATTLNEYQKHIEKDAALERRFQPVFVPEPTVDQTILILRGLRDRFEAHHKVTVSDEAIVAAARLSDRYITNRYLPDKAIDLIDQAAARVRISMTSRPAALQETEAQVEQLKREYDYARSRKQEEKAKTLESEIKQKQDEAQKQLDQWKSSVGSGSFEVTVDSVAEIVSKLTGVPVNELTTEERERLLEMEKRLHERVIGQEEAVQAVSDAVRLARAGLREGRRPIASFLFLGPTGVGKTELAKALADVVFGDEDAMVRIDMSEYSERHTVARLIGAPPGYVGYEEGGQLTERVRRRPYTVILLDEIEKAHPEVHNILLQVLDDGRLTDGKGRVVDFTNTIVIATSNIGARIIRDNLHAQGASRKSYDQLKDELMRQLNDYFRPEFINRIDDVIVFEALTKEEIGQIVRLQLESLKRTAHGQGIVLQWDQSLIDYIAEVGFQPEFGARELKRKIRSEVQTKLAAAMLKQEFVSGDKVVVSYDPEQRKVIFNKEKQKPSRQVA